MNCSKKRFNVDSPSFTPSVLSTNGSPVAKKATTISPKAASAAPFQPKTAVFRMSCFISGSDTGVQVTKQAQGSNPGTPAVGQENALPEWTVAEVQEFVPQGLDTHTVRYFGENPRIAPSRLISSHEPINSEPVLPTAWHICIFFSACQLSCYVACIFSSSFFYHFMSGLHFTRIIIFCSSLLKLYGLLDLY